MNNATISAVLLPRSQTAYTHKESILANGTKVEISITMKTTDAHPEDRERIFAFFKKCADTFHTVTIPGIVGG